MADETRAKINFDSLNQQIAQIQQGSKKAEEDVAVALCDYLNDWRIQKEIRKSAGASLRLISIDLQHLVEEVRQEAVMGCIRKFRSSFAIQGQASTRSYVSQKLQHEAQNLVRKHLGRLEKVDNEDDGDSSGSSTAIRQRDKYLTRVAKLEADYPPGSPEQSMLVELQSLLGREDEECLEEEVLAGVEVLADTDPKLYEYAHLQLSDELSQIDMAKKFDVTTRTIRNWEKRLVSHLRTFLKEKRGELS